MVASCIKRRCTRYKAPKSAVVAWKTSEQKEVSRITTIALGGLFIQTKNPPRKGSTLQMLIVTPRGYVRVRANVRNVVPGEGMGVAIISMDPEERGKLERWMMQLMEREQLVGALG